MDQLEQPAGILAYVLPANDRYRCPVHDVDGQAIRQIGEMGFHSFLIVFSVAFGEVRNEVFILGGCQ